MIQSAFQGLDKSNDQRSVLKGGAHELGLSLSEGQLDALLAYLDLIAKWNKVYNLTAVRDASEMMTHHLLDSLAAVPPLLRHLDALDARPVRLLDVGSGAGLPGVVFAICCPQIAVTCVDTVAKKAAFIKQTALTLKLDNLTGLHGRVEAVVAPFDIICSRAFASLSDFTAWSAGALQPTGVWMALKGKAPLDEIKALPTGIEAFHVEQLDVPELDADRCVVWMRR